MTDEGVWRPPLEVCLRDAYLRRLGFSAPPPATVDTLFALHRAQVERVPYESVWIWLGERRTVAAIDSVRYVCGPGGRGGYCYHMNGSLATLLAWLGFDVRWHVGGVQSTASDPVGATGNHLVAEVVGLPGPANPGGRWFVDAGLGDGPHEPLPLVAGDYRQGPFRYRLRHSDVVDGGWTFLADPRMSLLRMDFSPRQASPADFTETHAFLSGSPRSNFFKVVTAFRRDRDGVDMLRGLVLTRVDGAGQTSSTLDTAAGWFAALADVFGLTLSDVDTERQAALWARVLAAHQTWLATSQ